MHAAGIPCRGSLADSSTCLPASISARRRSSSAPSLLAAHQPLAARLCRTVPPSTRAQQAGLPRAAPKLEELSHPLLGNAPTLQLLHDRTDISGAPLHGCYVGAGHT